MYNVQTRPLRGIMILLFFLGIGFSSCSPSSPQGKNGTGAYLPINSTGAYLPIHFPYPSPSTSGTKYGSDIQGRTEFQRDYLNPIVSLKFQIPSISYKMISYYEMIFFGSNDDIWERGFALDVKELPNDDVPVSIEVKLFNPGDLKGTQVAYAFYRPDGSLIKDWTTHVTGLYHSDGSPAESWTTYGSGTTVNNTTLKKSNIVNTFLMFFEQQDGTRGYIKLPPIIMILE